MSKTFSQLSREFARHFGRDAAAAAFAPGRIEVLGNHTDYNEGFVLSAAIDLGTFALAADSGCSECRIFAADVRDETTCDINAILPSKEHAWSNYVKGVLAGIARHAPRRTGCLVMIHGGVPLGAGLSSSAALEMASGLALRALYRLSIPDIELAKIGQAAEHDFAGVKCGLLDQITSLFGKRNALVMTDFRSLNVESVPLGDECGFIMCDTGVKHALVESDYNERRASCETAAAFFSSALKRPICALRDVNWREWERNAGQMQPILARRSAHVIGENERVLKGRDLLAAGRLAEFGKLMFESHESSRTNFENSRQELDFLVATARQVPDVLGARLSGGGFGGSVVALMHPRDMTVAGHALAAAYLKECGRPCTVRPVMPSDGAKVLLAPAAT